MGDATGREEALRRLLERDVLLAEVGGMPALLSAAPPRPGLDARVFEGERAAALFRDAAAHRRHVERRGAAPPGEALPADARLTPLPAREAARRVLALEGPVTCAVLDPGGPDAFKIARWELARLAAGRVLAARAQEGAPPRPVELEPECLEVVPDPAPPAALVSRLARIAAQHEDVAAAYLFERRPKERARKAEAKLALGLVFGTAPALPQPLIRRIFGEAVLDLFAPDEPLVVQRIPFHALSRDGRYRSIPPFYRVRGLGWRVVLAKAIARLLQGIIAPRERPRRPPRARGEGGESGERG
jgi:hypothetical protein